MITEGFDAFWQGYLLGLAFTARKDDGDGEPLFSNPGGQIEEVVDLEQFEKDLGILVPDLIGDCLDFFVQVHEMIWGHWHDAGSDFHLTRNRHGAGFWDGDWIENGDTLTKLSKPYGTCELSQYDGKFYINN